MGDGFEKFEINDYDLDQAFNPLRRRKRATKNEQIYGMWADEEEDDEETPGQSGKGFGFSSFPPGKKKDYSAPVNFVSGGIKQGDKVTRNDDDQENGSKDEIDFEMQRFHSKRVHKTDKKQKQQTKGKVFAGLRSLDSNDKKLVNWEKYTKGIGSKLLQKMGHKQDSGLGREGQGISEVILAATRPGRGAIGFYGPEYKGPKITGENEDDNEKKDNEDDAACKSKSHWRKGATQQQAKTQKTAKQLFKTWDDVVNSDSSMKTNWSAESHNSVKIIDMTGKEQKVYSGYEAFKLRERTDKDIEIETDTDRNFDIPELRYNLDLIVNMTEEAIISNDRQLKHLKDQNITLKYEENELIKNIAAEKHESESLKNLLDLLDKFSEKSEVGEATLDDCKRLIETMQDKFYTEYKMFSLFDVAVTNVLPLFKKHFHNWNILEKPDYGLNLTMEWKLLIEQSSTWFPRSGDLDDMDPFHRILWESWMPQLRRAALTWEPRDNNEMINAISMWLPVLPHWMLENILEQIILPRIQVEVEDWDPTSDVMPIHTWIHPWLPLMGDRLQPIYGPIRHKLSRALSLWDPSDISAKKILQPWLGIFAPGTMECFLVQNILPKLESTLAEFQVNPANQILDAVNWVLDWKTMLGPVHLTDAFLRFFFPKWQNALYNWLSSPMVNYDEVMHWYNGWKALFADFLSFPTILNQFKRAMEMMNVAVSGAPMPPPNAANVQPSTNITEDAVGVNVQTTAAPSTFKELLHQKANEYGIIFMPIPNKAFEGKPIYKFGCSQIYIDRNVLFAYQNNHWLPLSIDQLISASTE